MLYGDFHCKIPDNDLTHKRQIFEHIVAGIGYTEAP